MIVVDDDDDAADEMSNYLRTMPHQTKNINGEGGYDIAACFIFGVVVLKKETLLFARGALLQCGRVKWAMKTATGMITLT